MQNTMSSLKRYRSFIIFILNLFLISAAYAVATRYIPGKNPSSEGRTEQHVDHYRDTLSGIDGSYDGTGGSGWLQVIVKTARVMSDNRFTYDRKNIESTLDKALEGNRHADCAHLISWSLQEYGILDKEEHFYSDSKGSISCHEDSPVYIHLNSKCDIIETGGISCSDTEKLKEILHVGDICCYNKHMNVVAGIDKKGDILYYDAGLVPTKKEGKKIYYTDKLTRPFSRKTKTFRKYRLCTIIRIKDQ